MTAAADCKGSGSRPAAVTANGLARCWRCNRWVKTLTSGVLRRHHTQADEWAVQAAKTRAGR